MTVEEREFVEQRERLIADLLRYFEGRQGQQISQKQVVEEFKTRGVLNEEIVISGIWRLLDMHRIDLDKNLSLVLAGD